MNKDQFKGQWRAVKGKVKQQWGKLTDDDIMQIDGKRDELLGKLQQRYGYAKEKADEELSKWEKMQKVDDEEANFPSVGSKKTNKK